MRFLSFSRSFQANLVLACGAAAFLLPSARAADAVLIEGPQATITAADIEADARQRIPEEVRASVLKQAKTVQQIGNNLYVRRVMAENAEKLRLDQSPEVQANLRVLRDKVLSDAYLQHLDRQNAISDEAALGQARSMYEAKPERFKTGERVRIRHILLEGSDDKAQAKAQELLKELRAGVDFAQLAKQHSIDKGTAGKGGDLGFFEHGRMVPEFEKAAFALEKKGDLSEPVATQFGLHILQLEERHPAGTRTFDEVRDALVQEVRGTIMQNARAIEAQKISGQATPQTAAIEAFAESYPSGK